ncbi:16S rRNA (guanine(527)-N(7))-methyltransferase RsmG [Enterococcus nangangensis]|uniref:16S rRNA (guanine(527)-N(7))-methyltransferase RsmG n=1 Tax=Enterococcus nangangensis TaxID=2559926 RepID=UPI0010F6BBE0|nr:16S rRNA (guanine(527)-N(7))-methyltransferase RsmG [Enterococcus nangangensis]
MTPEEFQQQLATLGITLTPLQVQQFQQYYQLLITWNEKINLTALTSLEDVYLKHFYDSLLLSQAAVFQKDLSLCDVGAGAGFPSLPLKIVFPELKIAIVDSLNKRINFLQTVVDELGLQDVSLYHSRAEDFGRNNEHRGQYDLVTARAVARLNILSELCLPLVKENGYFVPLKAKQGEVELQEAQNALKILGGTYQETLKFVLPGGAEERELFVFQKTKVTPKKYPRKAGTPNKQPL